MCGFVAIVTGSTRPVSFADLQAMTDRLAHRGPDDYGYAWASPDGRVLEGRTGFGRTELWGTLFGARRLSVLDLTAAAHQPFRNPAGSMLLAYNGEVYNYVELREELIREGAEFTSTGDTAVVLAAYERWGVDAFRRFNGMWACAIWDGPRQTLVASRDRFGIKPLYVVTVDGTWIFASEVKSIIRFPGIDRSLNHDQVLEYLSTGMTDHNDSTFFAAVRSVPAGSILELRGGRSAVRRYWSLQPSVDQRPESDLIEQYQALLRDAVRLRSRSDVPIGTMLSGGLDSTSIAALIVDQTRRGGATDSEARGLQSFHHTFTACWPGAPSVDEESEVDRVCTHLQLASHKLYPSPEQVWALLPRVTYFLDEPFENPVPVVQYLLMREAKARGVTVVLNGHGSDEALGGYPEAFVPPFLAGLVLGGRFGRFRREWQAFASFRQPAAVTFECAWALAPRAVRRRLIELAKRIQGHDGGIFSGTPRTSWSRINLDGDPAARMSPLGAALWRSYTASILPRWLRMEDRVSMAHSVESRVPFIDYRLVELSFRMPDTMKLQNGLTKWVLRRAAADLLPADIVEATRKRRFEAPYDRWLRREWRPLIEDLLLTRTCHVDPYLDVPVFRAKLKAHLAGDPDALLPSTVWRILQTEIWMTLFVAGREAEFAL